MAEMLGKTCWISLLPVSSTYSVPAVSTATLTGLVKPTGAVIAANLSAAPSLVEITLVVSETLLTQLLNVSAM